MAALPSTCGSCRLGGAAAAGAYTVRRDGNRHGGFAAALSIHRLEQNELTPEKGRVIVTGATGGVASLAIQMLAQLGYHVVALTGKDSEHAYLKSLARRKSCRARIW